MNSLSNKKRRFWQISKKEQRVALVLLAGLLAGVILPQRLVVSTSDSLEHRIFFKISVDTAKIKHGDYLLFQLQKDQHNPFIRKGLKGNDMLIKQIGCMPGEMLSKSPDGIFLCNHRPLGKALIHDSKGNLLPVFDFNGKIPEGGYFMVGSNPRSFDSRYFGLIDRDAFISKALPLW